MPTLECSHAGAFVSFPDFFVEVKARRKFLASYREAADRRSLQQDVAAGQKTVASLHAALKNLQLKTATPMTRYDQ